MANDIDDSRVIGTGNSLPSIGTGTTTTLIERGDLQVENQGTLREFWRNRSMSKPHRIGPCEQEWKSGLNLLIDNPNRNHQLLTFFFTHIIKGGLPAISCVLTSYSSFPKVSAVSDFPPGWRVSAGGLSPGLGKPAFSSALRLPLGRLGGTKEQGGWSVISLFIPFFCYFSRHAKIRGHPWRTHRPKAWRQTCP
ncbi:hypothetical protein IE53DRAFT_251407 [Violaceomyces palustris]|uniref:Uncharacterized protein n=1 Tax=Violaceomyces palustris TaxID=1673888 RepID=A0ACD0NNL0_9BASI|nr:hypothetical protein IE53DRAFT_251407 [Violaceomyces palustris]